MCKKYQRSDDVIKSSIEAKKVIRLAEINRRQEMDKTYSKKDTREIVKKTALSTTIILLSIMLIILLSVFLVGNYDNYYNLNKVLNIVSLSLSITLSILAIIFTMISGMNFENRFHDIDKIQASLNTLIVNLRKSDQHEVTSNDGATPQNISEQPDSNNTKAEQKMDDMPKK